MLRLRKILLYDRLYYLIFFIVLLVLFLRINFNKSIKIDSNTIEGNIIDYYYNDLRIDFVIQGNNKYKCTYYFNNEDEYNSLKDIFILGNRVVVYGEINEISKPTNPNTFDYSKYMKSKNIYLSIYVKKIELVNRNRNILYFIKEKLYKRIDNYKSKSYLYTFILCDNRYLDSVIKNNYQRLGISHLLAISGMHITILTGFVLKVLNKLKIKELSRTIISIVFVLFFLFLVSFTPSALRSGLFFILLSINKYYYFNIKISNILLLTISIILLLNPFIIYNVGFLFSASITYSLIIFSNLINKKNSYVYRLSMTSLIAFLVSLPISLYNYYELNLLTVFYNLIFVPLISLVIFPLSCITILFKVFDVPLYLLLNILERLSIVFNNINSHIIFIKPNIFVIIFLYIIIYFSLKEKRLYKLLLVIILIVLYNYNSIFKSTYVLFLDVGQGDSTLIHIYNKNILIDTGGLLGKDYSIVSNTTIPVFKSLGIKKIDYLILTHGDYDHMGESINLVENYKVDKVIFNCGEYNRLELELIGVLESKNINYDKCINKIDVNNIKLYFLQTREYNNENDNSNVIYTKINNKKYLFMGDSGIDKEKDILDKYNISNIDVLKVGHHGSKTSSSKEFIDSINPKYSIISVGKNNKFGHPNQEVLDNLENSKIYRTDHDGSIMFKTKNNKLKIKTYIP